MNRGVEREGVTELIVDLQMSICIRDVQATEEGGATHLVKQLAHFRDRVFIDVGLRFEGQLVVA